MRLLCFCVGAAVLTLWFLHLSSGCGYFFGTGIAVLNRRPVQLLAPFHDKAKRYILQASPCAAFPHSNTPNNIPSVSLTYSFHFD